jgi:VRR-NUC domain
MPVALPSPEVTGLHIPIVSFLTRFLAEGWEFTHPATGEHRDKRTAAKLKAMGAKPGWPDLILISPEGRFHGLEFKRRGVGRLSPEQRAFHERAKARGWPIATVDTIEAAIAVLSKWGCLSHAVQTRRQA